MALHEPLFTFYPMLDGQWIVWSPSRSLLVSSQEVLNRFGWHVNLTEQATTTIRFFPLDILLDRYYRSAEIRRLLWERRPFPPPRQVDLPSQVRIAAIRVAKDEGTLRFYPSRKI
ncbi:MAG: hypothetical protein GXP27_11995 [Planctomycetes bacterium]|nr:hypothetical protein [Planctomycetota bacterium]